MAETILVFTGVLAGATLAQAIAQLKTAFWDPLKVKVWDNAEDIRNNLDAAVLHLGSLRKEFETEVNNNNTRVPSETYMDWIRRVEEIKDLIAEYVRGGKEGPFYRWLFPCPDPKQEMMKFLMNVFHLLEESSDIKDKMFVDRAPEPDRERNGLDIMKFRTLRKQLEKILTLLKRPEVKRIGIHGTPGIGKTTVMRKLKKHDQVARMFDIVIWVKVSNEGSNENLRREDLLEAIGQKLELTMVRTSNADEVAERISTALRGKKYLLLLDDVRECLNLSNIGIPGSNNGSKIVLTTRLHLVCKDMELDRQIKVEYLPTEEAWVMFKDVLGSKTVILDNNPKICSVAREVCNQCFGVPLLIEKIASTFKLKDTESLWTEGLNSWRIWPRQDRKGLEEMYEMLRFCYDNLGDERYQKCFLYGALYPEDSDINIDSLLECWEAENLLVDGDDARKVCDNDEGKVCVVGNSILTHLKNVSLLEEGKRDYHVTMDRFMRHMALFISGDHPHECKHLVETGKNLKTPPDERSWSEKNRISLGANELNGLPDSPHCSMLSTLFLQANKDLQIIPSAFFVHMINLRVLDLSDTDLTSLPSSFSILSKLKVLHLNNCKQLMSLPYNIVKLACLVLLDIQGSGINYIPPHIEQLKFLKRLWVSFGNGNDVQDVSFNYDMISKLSRLEELVIDVKSPQQWTNKAVEDIMNQVATLPKFKKLRVCFPNKTVDVIEVVNGTVHIIVPEVRILLNYIQRSSWEVVRRNGSFRFVIGLGNLKYCEHPYFVRYKRYVKYCNGVGNNTQILDFLAEAEGFELIDHREINHLSDLGIPNGNKIQGFLIESCVSIQTIMDTVGGELLPNLEELFIKNLPMLKSIWNEERGSVTKLTTLVISNCRLLDKVFPNSDEILHLCAIRHLTIEKCDEMEVIIPPVNLSLLKLPNMKELILLDMKKLRFFVPLSYWSAHPWRSSRSSSVQN